MKHIYLISGMLLTVSACAPETKPTVTAPSVTYAADLTKSENSVQSSEAFSASRSATGIIVSGNVEKPSSGGKTDGAFIAMPEAVEAKLSGKSVTIEIRARSASSDALRVAFSTNEVGNSGWKSFNLNPEYKNYSFDYDIAELVKGRGDFLGFAPKGEVEIASFSIDIK